MRAEDEDALKRFIDANAYRIALDVVDAPAFLASYAAELELATERWPGIRFHALREHADLVFHARLSH